MRCRVFAFLFAFILPPALACAQAPAGPADAPGSDQSASPAMTLNVLVAPKSGVPVSGLAAQDFTVLDNKAALPIQSVKEVTPSQEPVFLILFLDEVNADYTIAVTQRDGVQRFLRANGGKLPYPSTVAIFTDKGAQIQQSFSTDGAAMAGALAHMPLNQREIVRGTSFGDFDRVRLSLSALHQLISVLAGTPGRKIVLWISPGWPLLSGPNYPVDNKMQRQIFDEIEYFSTQLRQADITLYNLNAAAVQEARETSYYEGFVKGIAKPSQVLLGDVALQVLAEQSGGQVLQSSTDVSSMIQKALVDLRSWYEVTFAPPPADKPDAYHHIEIKLDKPGLAARTRDGYYSNPSINPQP
ncbi:MAG TPA: VWA domain-containing protein [Terracidiphilus sp.]|nr:VWA domain-containing protein [Terracidiphilus sp.]